MSLINVSMPESIKKIESCAFTDCSELETIQLSSCDVWVSRDAFKRGKNSKALLESVRKGSADGEIRIKEGTTVIFDGAFKDREDVKRIIIPDSVVEI